MKTRKTECFVGFLVLNLKDEITVGNSSAILVLQDSRVVIVGWSWCACGIVYFLNQIIWCKIIVCGEVVFSIGNMYAICLKVIVLKAAGWWVHFFFVQNVLHPSSFIWFWSAFVWTWSLPCSCLQLMSSISSLSDWMLIMCYYISSVPHFLYQENRSYRNEAISVVQYSHDLNK